MEPKNSCLDCFLVLKKWFPLPLRHTTVFTKEGGVSARERFVARSLSPHSVLRSENNDFAATAVARLTRNNDDGTGNGIHNSETAPSGNIVGDSDTETLTNKTLTSPTLTNPTTTGTASGTGPSPKTATCKDPLPDIIRIVSWKRIFLASAGFGAGLVVVAAILVAAIYWHARRPKPPSHWDSSSIRATPEPWDISAGEDSVVVNLHYDVDNRSDYDYNIQQASDAQILARLKDGSLASASNLFYAPRTISFNPTLVPTKQKARFTLIVEYGYADSYPAKDRNDSKKLQDFLYARLKDLDGFVLLDLTSRYQINFPSAWEDLKPIQLAPPNVRAIPRGAVAPPWPARRIVGVSLLGFSQGQLRIRPESLLGSRARAESCLPSPGQCGFVGLSVHGRSGHTTCPRHISQRRVSLLTVYGANLLWLR